MWHRRISGRRIRWLVVAHLAMLAGLALSDPARAEGRAHSLQGLFCNSEEQLDRTLAFVGQRLAPRTAVALANDDAVVCTFVDVLRYVVDEPVLIDEIHLGAPVFKYQGWLVGVVVGDALRPVTPPAQIFFALQEKLAGVPRGGRS